MKYALILMTFCSLFFVSCSDYLSNNENTSVQNQNGTEYDTPSFGPHVMTTLLYHDYWINGVPNSGISHVYSIPQLVIDTIGGAGFWTEYFEFTTSPSEIMIGGEKFVTLGNAGYEFTLNFEPINQNGMIVKFSTSVSQGLNVIYQHNYSYATPFAGGTEYASGSLNNLEHNTNTKVQFRVEMYPWDEDGK
ncbi:MAG TPA: hypothetical protein VG961_14140 [Ignavibacteria bacterium]|nr:hypothetical protein [Ignavibacteria bacterium]